MSMENDRSTLKEREPHPAAEMAIRYLQSLSMKQLAIISEAFASTAIESNRLAEICSGTLDRLKDGLPVSDRYVLGLAWSIREILEAKNEQSE